MSIIENVLEKFKPRKKIFEMGVEEAVKHLNTLAINKGNSVFLDPFFREQSKYGRQNQEIQGAYFNEIIASFLVLTKLLLSDYSKLADNNFEKPEKIEQIIKSFYKGYLDYLMSIGVKKRDVGGWKKFIDIKEKNILHAKAEIRRSVMKEGGANAEVMIEYPERLIIRAAAFNTLYFFAKKNRAGEKNRAFGDYLLDKHLKYLLDLRKVLL